MLYNSLQQLLSHLREGSALMLDNKGAKMNTLGSRSVRGWIKQRKKIEFYFLFLLPPLLLFILTYK